MTAKKPTAPPKGRPAIEKNQRDSKKSNGVRGGARKGAGRKPGSATKKTRQIADDLTENGITPLEVMIKAMTVFADHAKAMQADTETSLKLLASAAGIAKDAAPYVHPRLAAIEHSGAGGGPIKVKGVEVRQRTDAELLAILTRLG